MANLIDTDLLTTFGTEFKSAYEEIFATETVTKYTISSANWSELITTINDTPYYTYTLTLDPVSEGIPTISIAPGSAVLPTEGEKELYSLVKYVTIDDSDNATLKLYAEEKPSGTFYIYVRSYRY